MVFPDDNLPITVELYVNNVWTNISSYVYAGSKIVITRGRSDEAKQVDPAICRLQLNNRGGQFSPRNPMSPYFGLIGRNTPLRVSVANGPVRLRLPGPQGQFYTADSSALSITGDIDLRSDISLSTWRPAIATFIGLIKIQGYGLFINSDGLLGISWSPDSSTTLSLTSAVPVPGNIAGRKSVRVTLDVNNGASGRTASFYYSDDATIDGTWVLFDTATAAGTTSIYDSANTLGAFCNIAAEVYATRVLSGIGGTEVANPDFASQTSGVTSFVDDAGNTWFRGGTDVGCDNQHVRFWGEVSTWPQTWDTTGRDVRTPIEAAGALRRLTAGDNPLQSTLRRTLPQTNVTDLVMYWPLEDEKQSQTVQAAVGRSVMRYRGAPDFATYSGFVSSNPTVILKTAMIYGPVDPYPFTGEIQVRFLCNVANGVSDDIVVASVGTAGTAARWDLVYTQASGGSITVKVYDSTNTLTHTSSAAAFGLDGLNMRWHLGLTNDGSDVDYEFVPIEIGKLTGFILGGTVTGKTIGRASMVKLNPLQVDMGGNIAYGHLTVESNVTSVFDATTQVNAYFGESAVSRVQRLSTEEGVPIRVLGGGDGDTVHMGYQASDNLVDLLRGAADSDGGILYEPRDAYGLAFRSLSSLQNQAPACTLSYADGMLSDFLPTEDDQQVKNDVTVSRAAGSQYRAVQQSGPLNVQQPPDGVGRYTTSKTLSLARDSSAKHQAGWLLHLGTVDQARYPTATVQLESRHVAADQDAVYQLLALDVGDRLVVTDPPAGQSPDDVSLLVQGYTEVFWQRGHEIKFNCTPEEPYHVGRYTETTARYDTDYSVLAAGVSASATSFSVATSDGPLWTTASGDLPLSLLVGGERVTATAISGSASPQTFTVTRSVNDVEKPHLAGAKVSLFSPVYYGLHGARLLTGSPTLPEGGSPVGTFYLGAAGVGVGDGSMNAWMTNHALRMAGTWTDGETTDVYELDTTYATWNNPIDVALGGLRSGQTWAAAAAGDYDSQWTTRFNNLKTAWGTRDPDLVWVRIAHEFNGDWSTWAVSDSDADDFVTAFRAWSNLLTTIMPGAHPVWSPANATSSMTLIDDAWPGADRVDAIGLDFYNSWPHLTEPEDIRAGFLDVDGEGNPVGVEMWRQYALGKGVPMYFGEIGNPAVDTGGGAGGGDAPNFFLEIETWCEANAGDGAGNVFGAVWFNISEGYSAHFRFFDGTGADALQPEFAAAFRGARIVNGPGEVENPPDEEDPETANTVTIGTNTYPLSGVNPTATSNPPGAPYPGARGVDQLVVYQTPITTTVTNQYGVEISVNSSNVVTAVNDRQASGSTTGTAVPSGGYVLSGHGAARTWLLANALVGVTVALTTGESGGGGSGGGEPSTGVPAWVVGAYWQMYNGPSVATITTNAPEYNMQFAAFGFGGGGANITFSPAFQSQASLIADIAASKAQGCRWLLSLGGGVPVAQQVFLRNETEATTAFNTLKPIIDTYGFEGVDYDLENGPDGFTSAGMLSLSQKLKNHYGTDFLITMVPRPYEDFYFQIAAAHHTAGVLDLCMFQFYDYVETQNDTFLASWIPSRLDAAYGYGVPYNKMVVGCITYGSYGPGANDVATYASIISTMKSSRGIRGGFIWESYLDSLEGWTFGPAIAALA